MDSSDSDEQEVTAADVTPAFGNNALPHTPARAEGPPPGNPTCVTDEHGPGGRGSADVQESTMEPVAFALGGAQGKAGQSLDTVEKTASAADLSSEYPANAAEIVALAKAKACAQKKKPCEAEPDSDEHGPGGRGSADVQESVVRRAY